MRAPKLGGLAQGDQGFEASGRTGLPARKGAIPAGLHSSLDSGSFNLTTFYRGHTDNQRNPEKGSFQ